MAEQNREKIKSILLSIQREDLEDPEHFVQLYALGTEKRRPLASDPVRGSARRFPKRRERSLSALPQR